MTRSGPHRLNGSPASPRRSAAPRRICTSSRSTTTRSTWARPHQRDAQWFADAWNELVVPGGEPIHIRRFHYRLMSRGWTKPNGEQYAGGTTEDVHSDYHM